MPMLAKLARRVTLRRALVALPCVATALLFLSVCGLGWTWGDWFSPASMSVALTYEILLIHAFPFLGAAAIARPKKILGRLVQVVIMGFLILLYCAAAHETGGWPGVGAIWGLGLATYTGFLFAGPELHRFQQLGARWLFGTVTLLFVVGIPTGIWVGWIGGVSSPELTDYPLIGFPHFLLMGSYELFGVYDGLRPTPHGATAATF